MIRIKLSKERIHKMKRLLKRSAVIFTAAVMIAATCLTSYADEEAYGPGFTDNENQAYSDSVTGPTAEINSGTSSVDTAVPVDTAVYPAGRVPTTSATGGNVDITAVNPNALWDVVTIYGQPAEKEGRYTWLSINLKDGYKGMISYRVYVNNGGWLPTKGNGEICGGTEGSTYIEAIQMWITGDIADSYDLYYAASTEQHGQMGFASEGQIAGAIDTGDALTDLKVVFVPKGTGAPASTDCRFYNDFSGRIGFDADGAYCYNEDGSGYTGWVDYDMMRFYFVDGERVTGWQYIDGLKFCFASNGELIQDVDDLIGKQDSYRIKVNKELNCLTVYAPDGDNGYIIPVKSMLTSVGDDTPIGVFYTPEKYRWRFMVNETYTQYATRIQAGAGFLIHSITYETTNENSLITDGYNNLGVTRSLGCIRVTCGNAKWIYDNCALGTAVEIYEDPNSPGPFYKPYQVWIPEDQTYDPTDPLYN